jgi:phenylpyruvate tautomerase PptA (4-oxalocrotonate tautomerase family)
VPIIDIELVCQSEAEFYAVSAAKIASASAKVFASPKGRTWVRLRYLGSECYAENEQCLSAIELPVFVTVLHTRPPEESALVAEVLALTQAIAEAVARPQDRVHVQYAPAGAGRQAFGGVLVE